MPHYHCKFAAFALVAAASLLQFAAGSPAVAVASPADGSNDVLQPTMGRPRGDAAAVVREDELMHKLNAKCGAKDVSSCVMLKLVTYVDQLMRKDTVELGDVVQIEKRDVGEDRREPVSVEVPAGAGRALADEAAFGRLMADKLWRYVRSRSLKIRALPDADVVVSASPDSEGSLDFGLSFRPSADGEQTGRGKNKNMGPMMAAMVMKMGMLKVMAFKFLALLVFKALFVSKLAFLLAVIIGLKKLFSQQKHVTYEVVAHPHHESHHGSDSYSSGWGRSSSEAAAHSMAYSGQVNP